MKTATRFSRRVCEAKLTISSEYVVTVSIKANGAASSAGGKPEG